MTQAIVDLEGASKSSATLAATWMGRFYPGIEVELGQQSVTIRSAYHGAQQLGRMWRAALLNEQLLESSANPRHSILEALLK